MEMKWNWNWGGPFIVAGTLVVFMVFLFTITGNQAFNEWTTRRAELPRAIESFEIGSDITVTDIRTGTEFTRIIRGPNGQLVVKSGWINRWGEHEIRTLDDW
jgi:hypothetical protein